MAEGLQSPAKEEHEDGGKPLDELKIQLKTDAGFKFYQREQSNKQLHPQVPDSVPNQAASPSSGDKGKKGQLSFDKATIDRENLKNQPSKMVLPTPVNGGETKNTEKPPISFFVSSQPSDKNNGPNPTEDKKADNQKQGKPSFFGSGNQPNHEGAFQKASDLLNTNTNKDSKPATFFSNAPSSDAGTKLNLMGAAANNPSGTQFMASHQASAPKPQVVLPAMKIPIPPKLQYLPATHPFFKDYIPFLEPNEKQIFKIAATSASLVSKARKTLSRRKMLADREMQSFLTGSLKRFIAPIKQLDAECLSSRFALARIKELIVSKMADDKALNGAADGCLKLRTYCQNSEKIKDRMTSRIDVLSSLLEYLDMFNQKLKEIPKDAIKEAPKMNKFLDSEANLKSSQSFTTNTSVANQKISFSTLQGIPSKRQRTDNRPYTSVAQIPKGYFTSTADNHQPNYSSSSITACKVPCVPSAVGMLFEDGLRVIKLQISEVQSLAAVKQESPLSLDNRRRVMANLLQ